ncbi:nucleotide sugar dehydrogenase [Halostella salina]|uniref:nucleotide sugar dehydrogenase n=1 Tax=Halostella salina TaxID=1547897 RepID=UPI000EF7E9B6|nr:nucleotide sugar dehydrogenase [Halostella salina]
MTGLQKRIDERDATVAVVGLGYVGLPLSCHFADAGFEVVGFDVDDERVARLRAGDSYIDDVDDDTLAHRLEDGFEPTTDPTALADCDAFVLAVPTGVTDGEPDMSAVRQATRTVAEHAPDREVLLVCSSTVYPGTTDDVIRPALETAGRFPEADTLIAVVPERLSPGGEYDFADIPLVVGADSDRERRAARALFDAVLTETVPVDATVTAESTKMLENTYRMVNVAFVNQFAAFAEDAGIDAWDVIEAAGTKPFGFQAFTPGPGVGGHCIPVDPQFLTWRARQSGTALPLVESAREVNEEMPDHVFDRIETALAARGTDLGDASVVALGVSYKPNVGDLRNSPALAVCESLVEAGASLQPVDPHVDAVDIAGGRYEPTDDVDRETVRAADAVLLLVDHDAFDAGTVAADANLVFDAQNAVPEDTETPVVRLGDGSSDLRPAVSESTVSRL